MRKINNILCWLFAPIVCCLIFVKTFDLLGMVALNYFMSGLTILYIARHLVFENGGAGRFSLGPVGMALLLLVFSEVAVYGGSFYKPASYPALVEVLFAFLFYYWVQLNLKDSSLPIIFGGLALVGLIQSISAVYKMTVLFPDFHRLGLHDLSLFKDRFFYGDWVVNSFLFLPYPLILLVRYRDRLKWVVPLSLMLLLLSATILFSFSRGAFLALLVFALIFNAAFFYKGLLPRKKLLLFNCAMIGLLLTISLPFIQSVYSTIALLRTDSQIRSVVSRRQIWDRSLYIAREKPILGFGSYNFAAAWLTGASHDDRSGFIRTPQNTIVGLAVEKGLLGVLTYLIVMITAFYTAVHKFRRAESDFHKTVFVSLTAALAAVFLYGLTYYPPLGNQGTACLTFFIFACIDSINNKSMGNLANAY